MQIFSIYKLFTSCVILQIPLLSDACSASSDWWTDATLRKALGGSIHQFAGDSVGDYFYPHGSVASQIGEGLGGPPDMEQSVDGKRFLSASRPHSGDERSAVVIGRDDVVSSAAIISYKCHSNNPGSSPSNLRGNVECQSQPTLTIFEHATLSEQEFQMYRTWAQSYYPGIADEERRLSNSAIRKKVLNSTL